MFEDLIASRVRPLAELLSKRGLERVRVADAHTEIELRRSVRPAGTAPVREEGGAGEEALRDSEVEYDVLTAELVGRVRFPRPPVGVGARVESGRELASIEALGIRNPVRTRAAGRVAVVYVEEGQAVDYGAPLFAIERST